MQHAAGYAAVISGYQPGAFQAARDSELLETAVMRAAQTDSDAPVFDGPVANADPGMVTGTLDRGVEGASGAAAEGKAVEVYGDIVRRDRDRTAHA